MTAPRQIPIKFPEDELNFDNLAITDSNRAVISAVRRCQHWPYHVFCLVGPALSGLTTIAKAWAAEQAGVYITGSDYELLSNDQIAGISERNIAIDRPDMIEDMSKLLFGISASKRHNARLLLTTTRAPSLWTHQSKDLESRLKSAPIAQLPAPDEPLLRARLQRACKRAYLSLPETVEDYLVTRLGLDYSRIEETVEALASLAVDRPVTIPLVREVLGLENETANLFDGD
jgi:chromosomal replication initiation ATPase DnaA